MNRDPDDPATPTAEEAHARRELDTLLGPGPLPPSLERRLLAMARGVEAEEAPGAAPSPLARIGPPLWWAGAGAAAAAALGGALWLGGADATGPGVSSGATPGVAQAPSPDPAAERGQIFEAGLAQLAADAPPPPGLDRSSSLSRALAAADRGPWSRPAWAGAGDDLAAMGLDDDRPSAPTF